jgi:N-acetylglucosamine malate deacetylase 2
MLSRATLPEVHRSQKPAGLDFLISRKRAQSRSIVCVTAHPGDEIISAGGSFADWKNPQFIHITEGSPRDLDRALQAGYECRDEYARARQREALNALHRAGFDSDEGVRSLGYDDGEVCEHLAAVTLSLAAALHESEAELVITHPYEGVHPDFDSTAFAVQSACALLANDGINVPARIEAAGYYEQNGELVIGRFLTEHGTESATVRLDAARRQLKRSMLDCLVTQQEALQNAKIHSESFRIAPVYGFTKPPHEGVLEYERCGLAMTGRRWRRLAAEALRVLGLADHS